ncbi:MAG: XkdF-like putative serine protease domain-containing protein [Ruminococcus sp.]
MVKTDNDSHFVTGIVYEPMSEDAHGNYMTADEIQKAAYWYAKNSNIRLDAVIKQM